MSLKPLYIQFEELLENLEGIDNLPGIKPLLLDLAALEHAIAPFALVASFLAIMTETGAFDPEPSDEQIVMQFKSDIDSAPITWGDFKMLNACIVKQVTEDTEVVDG